MSDEVHKVDVGADGEEVNNEPKLGLIVFVVLSIVASCLAFAAIPYGVVQLAGSDRCITWFGYKTQCWAYNIDAVIDQIPTCDDMKIRLKVGMALTIIGSILTAVSAFVAVVALAKGRSEYWRRVTWIIGAAVVSIFGVLLALGITMMLQLICGGTTLKDMSYNYGVAFGFQASVFAMFSFATTLVLVEWFGLLEPVYELLHTAVELLEEVPQPKKVRFVSFFIANILTIIMCALSMGVPVWYQTWTTDCANIWGKKQNCFLGITDQGTLMPNECTTFDDIYQTGRVFAIITLGFSLVSCLVVYAQYKKKSVNLRKATIVLGFFVSALALVTWSCFAAIHHRVLCPGQTFTFKDQGWSWGPAFVFWVTSFIFMFIASLIHAIVPAAF